MSVEELLTLLEDEEVQAKIIAIMLKTLKEATDEDRQRIIGTMFPELVSVDWEAIVKMLPKKKEEGKAKPSIWQALNALDEKTGLKKKG